MTKYTLSNDDNGQCDNGNSNNHHKNDDFDHPTTRDKRRFSETDCTLNNDNINSFAARQLRQTIQTREEKQRKQTHIETTSSNTTHDIMAATQKRKGSLVPMSISFDEDYENCHTNNELRASNKDREIKSYGNLYNDDIIMTDTEYEAPKVRRRQFTPSRNTVCTTSRATIVDSASTDMLSKPSNNETTHALDDAGSKSMKLKPFLDSTNTWKDLDSLRKLSPHVEYNEHNVVS